MKIVICDDVMEEALECKKILLDKGLANEEELAIIPPEELVVSVEEQIEKFDILIADIEYDRDDLDGIKLSSIVNKHIPNCKIIYLTNYLDFAPEVYETEHCYFVLKTNAEIMLPRAFTKAKMLYESDMKSVFIELVCDGKKTSVNADSIMYIEKKDRKITVETNNSSYESYGSMRAIAGKSDKLVRCHGSFIVNLKYIDVVNTDTIVMKNGFTVPIGRSYKTIVKEKYLEYWTREM